MRVLVWITESGWEACVDAARELPHDAEITLLHVTPIAAEAVAERGAARLIGRHGPRRPAGESYAAIAGAAAEDFLHDARERLARDARLLTLTGRPEREVVGAATAAELLILARDGEERLGPKSLGRHARFVVDHAPCPLLLLWSGAPPELETMPGGLRGPPDA